MNENDRAQDNQNVGTIADRPKRRLIVFTALVVFAALWGGLASPGYPLPNLLATLFSFVGILIAFPWWIIFLIERRGRIGWTLAFSPFAVMAAYVIFWLGISDEGLMLRFKWSRPALDRFVADLPEGHSEPRRSQWIGYIHVGGFYQSQGATVFHVYNAVFQSVGIGHVPKLPPEEKSPPRNALKILKGRLDPPWYFVSYLPDFG